MVTLISLLAIFGLFAAIPLLLAWTVTKLTTREQHVSNAPSVGRRSAFRFGVFCFIAYAVLYVALMFASVGVHMAHGDFYGARPAPFDPSLDSVDRMLSAIGIPIPSLAAALASYLSIHLSLYVQLFLHLANGVFLSTLAALAYSWMKRRRGRQASTSKAWRSLNTR